MIRKCFTINPLRTSEDIKSYEENLVKTNIYQGCEIFFPYSVSEMQKRNYINSVKALEKYPNFEIVCHLPYGADNNLATMVDLDRTMDRFYEAIDFADIFGVEKLTLHPGSLDHTLTKEEAEFLAARNIKKLCQYASKYNMVVMLENLVGQDELAKTPEEMQELIDNVNEPNIKFIFDCAHYHASYQEIPSKKDISNFAFIMRDDLCHLHLSDNNGKSDQHAALGKGTIDFVSYFRTLKMINYQGLYSSEVLFNDYQDLINTAKKMDEIASQI